MPDRPELKSIADLRKEYTRGGLDEADADPDPIAQFDLWIHQAIQAGIYEPTAMTLATITPQGEPAARVVLLKHFDHDGFVFFTNYDSDKGRDLAANPRAGLCFYWDQLERQVRVTGGVSKTSREASEKYFARRPRGSQLGAWVSRQSKPIAGRRVLEEDLARHEAQFAGRDVPCPPHWGGYCVKPDTIEFWQGRQNRLHDRLRYTRQADGTWKIERLAP